MREPSKTTRLERLSKPLKPKRAPFYVWPSRLPSTAQRYFPAEGWYWIPASGTVAVYLAHSYGQAEHLIRQQLEAIEQEELMAS